MGEDKRCWVLVVCNLPSGILDLSVSSLSVFWIIIVNFKPCDWRNARQNSQVLVGAFKRCHTHIYIVPFTNQRHLIFLLMLVFYFLSPLSTGGERIWWRRRRRPPGRVDSSVRGIRVEARGGRPLPPQGHRRAAVSDGGAVRTSDPRSEGGSRHVGPQPAQLLEDHGGHIHEAQWDSTGQPRLQSPTHGVLTLTPLLCFSRFPLFCLSTAVFLPLYPQLPLFSSHFFSFINFYAIFSRDCAKVCHESGYNDFIFSVLSSLSHIHCVVGNTTWILTDPAATLRRLTVFE